jgi:hypothetical protein
MTQTAQGLPGKHKHSVQTLVLPRNFFLTSWNTSKPLVGDVETFTFGGPVYNAFRYDAAVSWRFYRGVMEGREFVELCIKAHFFSR